MPGDIAEVPPEGALLPETFIVQRGAQRQAIIDKMRAEARKLMEKLWAQRQKDLPLKTWEEALVLASIVEKETGRNDERERVAAVFINRLKQNMRLQSDPTILYGIGRRQDGVEPADPEERDRRRRPRTTPTRSTVCRRRPSATRARPSIEAVLNPAEHQGPLFRGRRQRRPRVRRDAQGAQRQRAEVARPREGDRKDKEKAAKAAAREIRRADGGSQGQRAVVRTVPRRRRTDKNKAPPKATASALPGRRRATLPTGRIVDLDDEPAQPKAKR